MAGEWCAFVLTAYYTFNCDVMRNLLASQCQRRRSKRKRKARFGEQRMPKPSSENLWPRYGHENGVRCMNVINVVIIYFVKSPVECTCHTCKVGMCDFTFTSFNPVQVAFVWSFLACFCLGICRYRKSEINGSQLQRFLFSLFFFTTYSRHTVVRSTYERARMYSIICTLCVHMRPALVRTYLLLGHITRAPNE